MQGNTLPCTHEDKIFDERAVRTVIFVEQDASSDANEESGRSCNGHHRGSPSSSSNNKEHAVVVINESN